MKTLILLAALLLSVAPCQASMLQWWQGMGDSGITAFTINSYIAVTTDAGESGGNIALNDTGTESVSTGAGDITIRGTCSDNGASVGVVSLIVDGTTRATVTCDANQTKIETLSWTVTAGNHNVRVTASADPGAYATADTFRKPQP